MDTFLAIGLSNAGAALVLALLATAVGVICRRPALTHLLWVLVLLKLVAPPIRAVPLPVPAGWESTLAQMSACWTVAIHDTPEAPGPAVSADAKQPDEQGAALESGIASVVEPALAEPATELPELAASALTTAGTEPVSEPKGGGIGWAAWVGWAWVAGSLFWLLVAGIRIIRFQCLLRHARPAPPEVQELAWVVANRLGLARCPRVWVVPGYVSPLLWALGGRARLILPAALLERLGSDQQRTLLAHELAHARRRDHWVRWLELLVAGAYWWCPIAWWARRQLHKAEEACCDAWVLWALPAAAKAYARTLLQTVEFLDARPGLPALASGMGEVRHVKRRLAMILRHPRRPQLPGFGLVAAGLLGLAVLPLAPEYVEAQGPAEDPPAPPAVAPPAERGNVDLERRLRALEDKMERVLNAMEGRGPRGNEPRGRAPGLPPGAGQRRSPDDVGDLPSADKNDASRGLRPPRAPRALPQDNAPDKVPAPPGAPRPPREPRGVPRPPGPIIELGIDPERLKGLEKQINDAVHQALNPERMKELERQINEAVQQSVNPERVKEVQKRVQDALDRSISPEKLEALTRKIQEAVEKSLGAESRLRSRMRSLRERQPGERRDPEPVVGPGGAPPGAPSIGRNVPPPAVPPRLAPPGQDPRLEAGRDRDLERRMRRLEERMDRLLEAMEKANQPARR
jgi:beta-lactamase regulating signal transducer with metallopeptidase domain